MLTVKMETTLFLCYEDTLARDPVTGDTVSSSHKNKVVSIFTVSAEFTYG